ncbi:MAG: YihY family inner membrane protein [Rubrivivax sp.]|nr:YihY family inner membrane protein [Rubrivivax sp.]
MDQRAPDAETGAWQRLKEMVSELPATLRAWPWFDTLRTLQQRFREDRLGLTASSLTFTTLIALVPLVTVMLAVFTAFPMFAGFENALQTYFLQNLVPEGIAKPVLRGLAQFAGKARGMGTLGLVLLVVTALALVLTIDRTLNAIWRVRQPRHLGQRVLVYWAAMTLGPLALGMSLTLTSFIVSSSRGWVAVLPDGLTPLLEVMQFLLLAATTAGLFHYVPNTAVRWRHAWAGGLFVAMAFEVAKQLLAWYLDSVPTYSAVYGAFAAVPILLLWVYLVWVIVLLGAVIAAYAPSLQMRVAARPATPGWRFELALSVLRLLDAARLGTERGLPLATLATRLRADPLQLEPILELLKELDWVSVLDESTDPRHVLLCDPDLTLLAPLLQRTLLMPGPVTRSFVAASRMEDMTLRQALAV